MPDSDDDNYTVPLRDQRYFGAGIKRKRVQFVPSSSVSSTATRPSHSTSTSSSAGDVYLSIVLKSNTLQTQESQSQGVSPAETLTPPSAAEQRNDATCNVCGTPMSSESLANKRPHEATLVHQVCLEHSHPPSAIDRRRKGLAILQAQGWNPDDRRGLGAAGEGILHPIKPRDKKDTLGLGAKPVQMAAVQKVEKLDAGKVVKRDKQDKQNMEKLRRMFYSNDDLERYLGSDAI